MSVLSDYALLRESVATTALENNWTPEQKQEAFNLLEEWSPLISEITKSKYRRLQKEIADEGYNTNV